jgi:hypothetical protein
MHLHSEEYHANRQPISSRDISNLYCALVFCCPGFIFGPSGFLTGQTPQVFRGEGRTNRYVEGFPVQKHFPHKDEKKKIDLSWWFLWVLVFVAV